MAIKNKELMLKIIEEDCKAKGMYITEDGDTCAIGGLLQETGFDMSYFTVNTKAGTKNLRQIEFLPKALRHLREYFGLTKKQAIALQSANDGYRWADTLTKRRAAVKEVVAEFETPQ